jgi:hypothetical protein
MPKRCPGIYQCEQMVAANSEQFDCLLILTYHQYTYRLRAFGWISMSTMHRYKLHEEEAISGRIGHLQQYSRCSQFHVPVG